MPLGFLCIECIKPVISKQFLPLTRLFALHTPTCISGILISHVCGYLIWSCLFIFFWSKLFRKLFCKLSILTVIEYEHSNHKVIVNLDINSPSFSCNINHCLTVVSSHYLQSISSAHIS
jgi:hypothetical protein